MIVRLLILLALLLGTLPAPATAGPACHDAGEMAAMAMPGTAMGHPATPAPDRTDKALAMGKALCVGCIAPTTMKPMALTGPTLADARHAVPAAIRRMTGATLTPEPPPPRG